VEQRPWFGRCALALALVISIALGPGCGREGAKGKRTARPAELTVAFSSDLLGKIRSCGCVVEDMGGLGRWATFTQQLRSSFPSVIAVDAGDIFGADLSFTATEAELAFDAMNVVGLDAITVGETDFVFGLTFLQGVASRATFPIVSANIVDPATGQGIFGPPYIVKTLKGGLRVAITGVLDDAIRFPAYIDVSRFKVLPAIETMRKLVPEMKSKADFLIVLSHMGMDRSFQLAREVPDFDLVVVGHAKPVIKKLEKQGKSIMLATGGQGQYIGQIDLSLTGTGAISELQMRLVPLEDSIPLDPKVVDLFKQYGVVLTDKEMDHAH
jgi:2',3'-cyclic-nucleotide 2'-phosphodiesterase/3'-nucleotidase